MVTGATAITAGTTTAGTTTAGTTTAGTTTAGTTTAGAAAVALILYGYFSETAVTYAVAYSN